MDIQAGAKNNLFTDGGPFTFEGMTKTDNLLLSKNGTYMVQDDWAGQKVKYGA